MNSHYEELYGVGLLDDLHNYFPAILYEPERFQTVRGILHYIQTQTRNRFDLFSLGQREYQVRSPPPPPPPTTVPLVQLNATVSNVPLNDVSGNAIPSNSNFVPAGPSLRAAFPEATLTHPVAAAASSRLRASPFAGLQYIFNVPEPEEEENTLTLQLLNTLLRLPTNPIGRGAGMESFLQPVVVRPTPEQIEANTTVGSLVSDTEHSCAICQDVLQPDQEGRKLNACGHWFHKHCIDTWLEGNVHCPVCRHDIREPASQES